MFQNATTICKWNIPEYVNYTWDHEHWTWQTGQQLTFIIGLEHSITFHIPDQAGHATTWPLWKNIFRS